MEPDTPLRLGGGYGPKAVPEGRRHRGIGRQHRELTVLTFRESIDVGLVALSGCILLPKATDPGLPLAWRAALRSLLRMANGMRDARPMSAEARNARTRTG